MPNMTGVHLARVGDGFTKLYGGARHTCYSSKHVVRPWVSVHLEAEIHHMGNQLILYNARPIKHLNPHTSMCFPGWQYSMSIVTC